MSRRIGLLLVVVLAGCERARAAPVAVAGAPLPGLSAEQQAQFAAGRKLFDHAFTSAEGVGPTLNEFRCSSCHDLPTLGGQGADFVRKATRFADGRCDLLVESGGDLFQTQVTEELRGRGIHPEAVPRNATAVAMVSAPALFGIGLVEAIPDKAILSRTDPEDRDRDGISGRAGTAVEGGLGRFGRKATFRTLRHFVAGAAIGEMGLTSAAFPAEESIGGQPLPNGVDGRAEPELDTTQVNLLTDFVRFLAVPAPDTATAAARDSINVGRKVFTRLACDRCHTPEMPTGRSEIDALDRRRLQLYSDLLLHDLGPENLSICAQGAGPSEWRTTPLMGVGLRIRMWHDGRAHSLEAAIGAHGGEAAASRDKFIVLSDLEKMKLIRFLRSL